MLDLGRLGDKYSQLQFDFTDQQGRSHYHCVQDALGRPVSIKVLTRQSEEGSGGQESLFQRGARAAAGIQHSGIIQVVDYESTSTHNLLVTELVEGESLQSMMERQSPLPQDDAFRIARQLAEALSAAHQAGRVHRNLNPREIFVTPAGQVKLGGFEAALLPVNMEDQWRDQSLLGNVFYMSPEQAGNEQVAATADVYALGVLLYLMLTGQPPWSGSNAWAVMYRKIGSAPEPPSRHRSDLSDDVDRLLLKLLAASPADRPQDMTAVLEAIDRFHATPAERRDEPSERITRRFPFPLSIAYLLVAHEMEWSSRLNRLLDLFEATLKYCSAVALLRVLADGALDWPAAERATLRRPSLGHWWKYLEVAVNSELRRPSPLDQQLRSFYGGKCGDDKRGMDIVRAGVELRNRFRHGATQREAGYQAAYEEFRPRLDAMLATLDFLGDYPLARTERLRFENGSFVVHYRNCMGAASVFAAGEAVFDQAVEDHCFGVIDTEARLLLDLSPLLEWRPCQICGEDEIVYYNGMKSATRLSFLNYQKGHAFDEEYAENPFVQKGLAW